MGDQRMSGEREAPMPLLEVKHLKKYFPIQKSIFRKIAGHVRAVDDVSFFINEAETLGLVGESGCGKTTTGRCIPRLLEPTSGELLYVRNDVISDIATLDKEALKQVRREIQIIFQDPVSSLNPRMTVKDIVAEPLEVNGLRSKKAQTEKVAAMLNRINIPEDYMGRYPHEFSGGQRQRIGIARSLILSPRLVICDEPVSALDVSIQAQVINLLARLQKDLKLTYLFIAHDLGVIEYICNRVIVMYLGKMVEVGSTEKVYQSPKHPYTETLLYSIPMADPLLKRKEIVGQGSMPDPSNPPKGCYFHTRCRYAEDICRKDQPELLSLRDGEDRFVACHKSYELDLKGYNEIIEMRRRAGV